jgi:hypothetical protein
MPHRGYDTSIVTMRRSSKDCLVSYNGNYYSVPAAYARQTLMLKETETGDRVVVNGVGEVIAQHRLLAGRRERSIDPAHYAARRAARIDAPPGLPLGIVCAAPQVEVRPLSVYAAAVEAVAYDA